MLKVPFSDIVRTAEVNMTSPFKRSDEFSCLGESVFTFLSLILVYIREKCTI